MINIMLLKLEKVLTDERLAVLQKDKKVQEYTPDLFVTWAKVSSDSLNGVEAYLFKELNPVIHENIINSEVIIVNLP
jgi:hypothetical protein